MNIIDSSGWLEYFSDGPNAIHYLPPLNDISTLIEYSNRDRAKQISPDAVKRAREHNIYSRMIREKVSAIRALTSCVIAAALLAGCITSSYPKNWPSTVPATAS
jgi:hypothetical protein